MVSRIPPRPIVQRQFRIFLWAGGLALALTLLFPVLDGTAALAATPYEYTDGSEGDPGDGVLNPRGKEDKEQEIIPLDGFMLRDGRLHPRVSAVQFWSHPYIFTPDFRFVPMFRMPSESAPLVAARRGWHHAR